MSVVNLVKGCPLFYELYDEEIESIIKHCYVASYEADDFIFKQGEDGTDICIVLSGEAKVEVTKNKKRSFITNLHKGDLFGELVLINETKRTADIISTKNTDILVISFDNFFNFFNKRPKIFSILILNVARLLTQRLKTTNKIIENNIAEDKVA